MYNIAPLPFLFHYFEQAHFFFFCLFWNKNSFPWGFVNYFLKLKFCYLKYLFFYFNFISVYFYNPSFHHCLITIIKVSSHHYILTSVLEVVFPIWLFYSFKIITFLLLFLKMSFNIISYVLHFSKWLSLHKRISASL